MINMEHYIIISQFEKMPKRLRLFITHCGTADVGKKMKANYLGSRLRSVFIINYKNTSVFL